MPVELSKKGQLLNTPDFNFLSNHSKRLQSSIKQLKSDSDLPKKNLCYLLDWQPFKNDEKCSLFHLKSSFRSEDIYVFVTTFSLSTKNSSIRKIRLTSKFMASQPGLQTIAIHILPNISQRKGNQTTKFGQLIEYNKINIFLQKLCGK